MNKYLCFRNDRKCFEEVPENIFKNRAFAIDDKGNKRYCNSYLVVNATTIVSMSLDNVNAQCLGHLFKYVGGSVSPTPWGGVFVECPTHIKFKRGNRLWLVEVATGAEYKMTSKPKEEKCA